MSAEHFHIERSPSLKKVKAGIQTRNLEAEADEGRPWRGAAHWLASPWLAQPPF